MRVRHLALQAYVGGHDAGQGRRPRQGPRKRTVSLRGAEVTQRRRRLKVGPYTSLEYCDVAIVELTPWPWRPS